MQQPLGGVQVVKGIPRHGEQRQGHANALANQASAIQHSQADAQQELVDDVVVVEMTEHTQPAQHFTHQQQRDADQQ
ncbi:hypothetical protein D3C81_1612980 [compost metagenome]